MFWEFFERNMMMCLFTTQQTCECYMPRITDDLTMSNRRVLIGRACHEQYTPFGLLLTRTAEHFFRWSNTFSDNYVNGAMNRSLLHCVLPRPRRNKLPAGNAPHGSTPRNL